MLIRGRKSLRSGALTKQAIVDVAVIAMLADGEGTDEELEMLAGTIAQQEAFANVDEEQFQTMIDESLARVQGWDDLSHALEQVTEEIGTSVEDRAVAFGIAYSVACADGEIADEEDAFLSALADSFELSQEQVDTMIDAVNEALESAGEEEEEEEEEAPPAVAPAKHWLNKRGDKPPLRKLAK